MHPSQLHKHEPWRDPNSVPHVELIDVVKVFDDHIAVNNISLDIYKGEFFSLLGPSGCGKTTLLRMLAGFETPTSGKILLEGEDMSKIPPYERPVNMMFQSYALFPHMTVEDNIAFGLKQDKIAKAEIRKRVDQMLELVQMGKYAKRKPHQLSGGQRQRVALARSIVKKPKLLLLDEPLGALDKRLREQTQFELMNIQEELGITFVIVTHDQEEAMTVSSRIAVMDTGELVQVATPTEIYEYPNSRYVAEFVGDVNIFEGVISDISPKQTTIESYETETPLVCNQGVGAVVGAQAWVAVRPEKLDISLTPPEDITINCVEGEVWDIGYLGDMSIYHVKLDNGKMVTASQVNHKRLTEHKINYEDRVYISFDKDSGIALIS
ncbi:polyamine ABC transporter ATP-binding protein [Ignatzschineria sp. RMDPL8A]|uniref:ABC transporter ATP-binding protein n=1 Tax=Ignatzschineria sp. RMDPL8A TaxID=2999236 RepID=UPI0016A54D2D|nr:polyamine ABC transporter ATP-binding protein [Ignatzschineria sp. RMDPL8A]MDG9729665.1 polyamine ABC transporter ATP-binding protein [Ignatzschineria sp. RMDPL8A]NLD08548.1 polyamine ABC transporter ATP-binding protein [Xanthomonadaceae bacterium]